MKKNETFAGEPTTGYDASKDSGPCCLFCQMGTIYDPNVQFSPTVGDYFHPNCAKLTVDIHDSQQPMDAIEEARHCLMDEATRNRNLGRE